MLAILQVNLHKKKKKRKKFIFTYKRFHVLPLNPSKAHKNALVRAESIYNTQSAAAEGEVKAAFSQGEWDN